MPALCGHPVDCNDSCGEAAPDPRTEAGVTAG